MNLVSNNRYLPIISGLFVGSLIISNVASSKMVALGSFVLPGGSLIFPVSFIFNDILTEVYGYARSRMVIWTGLSCQFLAALFYLLIGYLPSASFWHNQDAYMAILGTTARIAVASLTAYFIGEFANAFMLSRMKYSHGGARGIKQGWRFVASTIVGEGVDSVIFMVIAFLGTIPLTALFSTTITIYIYKVTYEILATPLSVRLANYLKRKEGIDIIDDPNLTNYSPFSIS